MTQEVQAFLIWVQICLIISAVCTSGFVISYSLSPWYKSPIGRLIWLMSFSFALAIDLTVFFQYVQLDMMLSLWINIIGFTFIACSSAALTVLLWKLRIQAHKRKKKESNYDHSRQFSGEGQDPAAQQPSL